MKSKSQRTDYLSDLLRLSFHSGVYYIVMAKEKDAYVGAWSFHASSSLYALKGGHVAREWSQVL